MKTETKNPMTPGGQKTKRECGCGQKAVLILGICFLASGLVLNEWLLTAILSADGVIDVSKRIVIWGFDIVSIAIGATLILLRRRISFANLVLVAISCAVGVVCVEVFLRVLDHTENEYHVFRENPNGTGSYRLRPGLDYEFRYEQNGEMKSFLIQTNSRGMRWREVEPANPEGLSRIAFLGDSFTFGESADRIENSFVGVFEAQLDRKRFEALNFGIDGYGVPEMRLLLEEDVLAFKPEYVFLMVFVGNDFRDSYLGLEKFDISSGVAVWNKAIIDEKVPPENRAGMGGQMEVGQGGAELDKGGASDGFLASFKLVQRLQRALVVLEQAMSDEPASAEDAPERKAFDRFADYEISPMFTSFSFWTQVEYPDVGERAKAVTLDEIARVKAICDAHDITLAIATIPFQEQVYIEQVRGTDKNGVAYDVGLPQRIVSEFAATEGIPCLDLLPPLREHVEKTGEEIFPCLSTDCWDIHFNNAGHALVGKMLAEFFRTHVMRK